MSYILDALRKSERERQMAAGKISGMLYPIQMDQKTSARPWIVLASVVMLLIVLAAVWWFWPQPELKKPVVIQRPISAESFPKLLLQQPHLMTEPDEEIVATDAPLAKPQVKKRDAGRSAPVEVQPNSVATQAPRKMGEAVPADPLADMPELIVHGYVHNEMGGSFAMINDRLLQEGDEIAPGLKLVKILESKGVFNYNGHEFTR
ncbi:MAG: general secretion pathway protein GspB [Gallionella sp.]